MKQIGIGVCALLWALPASAQVPWTQEELKAGTKSMEYTRYVPAGKKVQLYTLTALDVDCRVEDTTADIVKEPEHGRRSSRTPSTSPFSRKTIRDTNATRRKSEGLC